MQFAETDGSSASGRQQAATVCGWLAPAAVATVAASGGLAGVCIPLCTAQHLTLPLCSHPGSLFRSNLCRYQLRLLQADGQMSLAIGCHGPANRVGSCSAGMLTFHFNWLGTANISTVCFVAAAGLAGQGCLGGGNLFAIGCLCSHSVQCASRPCRLQEFMWGLSFVCLCLSSALDSCKTDTPLTLSRQAGEHASLILCSI